MTRVRRPNGGAPTGTNALCTSLVSGVCSSYYERTWWAGQQILAEWRTADGTPNPTNSGTVGYVHAPGVTGIDAPVAVITTGGASAGVRVITEDWRGMGESSLFPNGAPADNTLYGGTAITVAWPSGRGAYFTPYLGQPSGSSVEHTWLGSLVEHGAGAAGLMYRRNRYYDPQSGRFTQQDPIGLAGGVNVYGFAGGDPVSYSDPFGLCPPEDENLSDCPSSILPFIELGRNVQATNQAVGLFAGLGIGGGAIGAVTRTLFGGGALTTLGLRAAPAAGAGGAAAGRIANGDFERTFETTAGAIRVFGEAATRGRTLTLNNFMVYPDNASRLQPGPAGMRAGFRAVAEAARAAGYDRLIINFHRTSGANVGKVSQRIIDFNP